MTAAATLQTLDHWPADAAQQVDQGLDDFNRQAGPMHLVRPLACVARDAQGHVLGGALGRSWGLCAELQQLWVDETRRGQGLGSRLLRAFEAGAESRGCQRFYLDTFSFQARGFYERHGYEVCLTLAGYAPGVQRHTLQRQIRPHPPGPIAGVMIHVGDVAAAQTWYQQLLPGARRCTLPDTGFECLRHQGVQIELVLADARVSAGAAGSVVYWQVDDFDAALDRALRLGATLYRGPLQIEQGERMAQVRDPWGNCVGLRGPSSGG